MLEGKFTFRDRIAFRSEYKIDDIKDNEDSPPKQARRMGNIVMTDIAEVWTQMRPLCRDTIMVRVIIEIRSSPQFGIKPCQT